MTGPARGSVLDTVRGALVDAYGTDPQEASVTFLGTGPMRILRFVDTGTRLVRYVSLGCSADPMGDPSEVMPDPNGPRAELCLTLRGGVDGVVRALAILASTPAVEGLVLAEGALIDLGEPLWPGASFTAVVLRPPELAPVEVGAGASPVTVYDAVPVTHTEAAWARVGGVDELAAAWAEAGVDVRDPGRPAVAPRAGRENPPR